MILYRKDTQAQTSLNLCKPDVQASQASTTACSHNDWSPVQGSRGGEDFLRKKEWLKHFQYQPLHKAEDARVRGDAHSRLLPLQAHLPLEAHPLKAHHDAHDNPVVGDVYYVSMSDRDT